MNYKRPSPVTFSEALVKLLIFALAMAALVKMSGGF